MDPEKKTQKKSRTHEPGPFLDNKHFVDPPGREITEPDKPPHPRVNKKMLVPGGDGRP